METTRHLTATVYVVDDGATALHDHKRHDVVLPPGGHVDRGELPHEAGIREVEEEMGLTPTLVRDDPDPIETDNCRSIPRPHRQMLYDVNVHDGAVGHQHVDQIFFATVPSREIDPGDGEVAADAWDWYAPADLRESAIDPDVAKLGIEAIRAATDPSP